MTRMTEEEADALDEQWTKTTPEINTDKPGCFSQHMAHLVEVDDLSAAYIRACADAAHKTATEIIGEMVRERMNSAYTQASSH